MQPEEGTGWLLELLSEVQLQQYFLRLRDDLNVTRLSHFEYVKNEDLEKIGMGRPGGWHVVVGLACFSPCSLQWVLDILGLEVGCSLRQSASLSGWSLGPVWNLVLSSGFILK